MYRFQKLLIVGLLYIFSISFTLGVKESWAGDCTPFSFEYPISNASVQGKISAGGKQKCDSGVHVWMVLSDGSGYYLQSPEISLNADGTWDQEAIRVNECIKSAKAVLVNEDGHKFFKEIEKTGKWEQLKGLPDNSKILANVKLITKCSIK